MVDYRAEIWDNSGTIGIIFDVVEQCDLSDFNFQIQKEYNLDLEDVVHELSVKNLVFRSDELREAIAKISHWAPLAIETEIDERVSLKAIEADEFVFELKSPQSLADNLRGMADLLVTVKYSELKFSISLLVDHSCLDQFGQSIQ